MQNLTALRRKIKKGQWRMFTLAGKRKWLLLSNAMVVLTIASLLFFTLSSYRTRFHSDAATAGMLAVEQLRAGRFLLNDWAYSQDFWPMFVLNSVYFLDGIVESVFLRTQIWIAFQDVTLFILAWVLLNQLTSGLNRNIFIIYLFSGVSFLWSEFFFGQGQYGNVLLFTLAATVLILNIIRSGKYFGIAGALLFLVMLYANSTSIRYVALFYVPAIVSLAFISIARVELRKTALALSLNVSLSLLFGLLLFFWLKSNYVFLDGVNSSSLVSYESMLLNNLPRAADGFFSLLSDEVVGKRLASLEGGLFFLKLFVGFFLVVLGFLVIKNGVKNYKECDPSNMYILVYSLTLFLIALISVLFMSTSVNRVATARYLMLPVFFLVVISSSARFFKLSIFKNLALISIAVVGVWNIFTLYIKPFGNPHKFDPIINKLKDEGLVYGVASYWNADVITALSDYKLKVFHVEGDKFLPWYFMSSPDFYKPNNAGRSFVIFSDDEIKNSKPAFFSGMGDVEKVISFDGYKVYVYMGDFANHIPDWLRAFKK